VAPSSKSRTWQVLTRHIKGVVVTSSLLSACGASSTYSPQRRNHVYLVLQDGKLSYYQNQVITAVNTSESAKTLGCSARAKLLAEAAKHDASTGETLMIVGLLFGAVGSTFAVPAAVAHYQAASAKSVDAMNIYNDGSGCFKTEAPALHVSAQDRPARHGDGP
jgi:hypothetical protein